MYKEVHNINNCIHICGYYPWTLRGEYDQNYNGSFNYTGNVSLFKLVMGTWMFILLFFMPLYNKNKDKAKIIMNSLGNLGGLAIFKDMEDKTTSSEVD